MKLLRNKLIQGTLLLTAAGFVTRLIGFAYRIFLADILGNRLLGIYQLIFPLYGICFTIYGAGIQTAISQLIASNVEHSDKKIHKDLVILKWGLFLSLSLSLTLTGIVSVFSQPIATHLLLETACSPYLKILSLLFPFCGISACISGYFYGKKEAAVPAASQIIEQLARVSFVVLFCIILSANKQTGCILALFGLVIGEAAGCFYNCFRLYRNIHHGNDRLRLQHPVKNNHLLPVDIKQNKIATSLIFLAFTLTSSKLIISILHSVEAVFIPAALRKFGCTPDAALSIYGILSGIALPFILFPSTITNSFAVMLLPAIAQAHAEHFDKKIKNYVTLSCKYSLYIGYLFTCIFLLFGKEFGNFIFNSIDAGNYIYVLSWLCPFLYLSTTLTSIINGLGKTQLTFFITSASLLIKICFLIFYVPKYGIQAYLAGSLISQIIMTLLEFLYLKDCIHLSFPHFFLIPTGSLLFIGYSFKKIYLLLPKPSENLQAIFLIGVICLFISLLYLIILKTTHCINKKTLLASQSQNIPLP